MPERIQLHRSKGWRKPRGAIVVARPSKWGNPFRPCRCTRAADNGGLEWGWFATSQGLGARPMHWGRGARSAALADCVEMHAWWLLNDAPMNLAGVSDLRGHDLACWCPLDAPCHADILLELAND